MAAFRLMQASLPGRQPVPAGPAFPNAGTTGARLPPADDPALVVTGCDLSWCRAGIITPETGGYTVTTACHPNGGSNSTDAYWSPAGNTWSGNTWLDGPHAGQAVLPA